MRFKSKILTLVVMFLVLAVAFFSTYATSEAWTYKVQSGDSLYKIAKKLGSSVDQIISDNNLKTITIMVGQALFIPDAGPKVATVTATKVNFRTGPSTKYRIIKTLAKGTQGTYLGSQYGWYQVKLTTGETGWLIGWSAAITSGVPKTPTPQPSRSKTLQMGTVTTSLNMRTGPNTQAKIVTVLQSGTKVQILRAQSSWLQVLTPAKVAGWVSGKYISTVQTTPAPSPQPTTPPVINPIPTPAPGSETPSTPPDNNTPQPPATPPDNSVPSTPQEPTQPAPTTGKNVMGYYVRDWPQDTASQKTLENNGDLITTIGTFEFTVDEQGNLGGTHDAQAMDTAKKKNVKVLALVHNIFGNSTKSKAVAKAVTTNPTVRAKTVDGIFNLMERYGYDGINIDIEYVAPGDRDGYTAFIKGLAEKLKPKGYVVTVSVPAKLKEDPNHGWSGGFDYAALNNYADLFMLMAYDEHGYVSGPGPIASVDWDEQIINYTKSVLPLEKILLGIPTYGFDWTVGQGTPKYLSYQQAMKIAQEKGKTILWDDVAKVPYFKYTLNGQNHEVWFENARSMEEKLKLVNKHNLAGIAIWRLGFEDPASWAAIDKVLDIQK